MSTRHEKPSQKNILVEYFKKHPNKDVCHPDVVDWAVKTYKKRTGKVFRDPDRGIRTLHQNGFLIKVKNGVYRYDPEMATRNELEDFSPALKRAIFERDGYKCVMCGKGRGDGVTIHADHIKPKDLGGRAVVENGQTLCAPHNFLKKNFKQTETGKKMFIRLYELSKITKDKKHEKFCADILQVFEDNDVNGHVEWKR